MNEEIRFQDVSFEFSPSSKVIHNISLTIERGTLVGIVGANGSGKTTLARLLNGNLHPTSGKILVDGLSPYFEPLQVKRLVGIIQADAENQIIAPTVYDEVSFGLHALGMKESEVHKQVESALDTFGLSQYRDTHPFYLSVGEQFRLLVAGAIVRRPSYLILDEVLSMLDSPTRKNFVSLLVDLQNKLQVGIVLITHRIEDLINTDKVIVLDSGRVAMEMKISDILRHNQNIDDWNIELPLGFKVSTLLGGPNKKLIRNYLYTLDENKGI